MVQALPFLWSGLAITIGVSVLVVVLSLIFGCALGVLRVYGPDFLHPVVQTYCDVIRGIPVLVLIFFVFYGLPAIGVNLNNFVAAACALTLFSTAQVAELVRGALQSIHFGQMEAGKAIGLTFTQRLFSVIFPQAIRRFLPAWVNSVTDAVKGSSLVSLIGVVDLTQAVQQVIGRTYTALPLYLLATAFYFSINYSLSAASRRLEGRLNFVNPRG